MAHTAGPVPDHRSPVRHGVLVALVVTGFAVVVHLVVLPLHENGFWQSALAFVQVIDYLLQAPGLYLADKLGLRAGHHTGWAAWAFGLAVNGGLYFFLGLGWQTWRARSGRTTAVDTQVAPAPMLSRRGFLTGGVKLLGLGAGAGLGYGLIVEPRWFRITWRDVSIRDLPPELDGLRVLQLTDVHHGPWLSRRYVREIIDACNQLEPDLICLTGDYVHHSAAYVKPVVEEMARLRPKIGMVGILGNHDWWEGVDLMRAEFRQAGIPLIDNDRRVLTPGRELVASAADGLAICGVGDLWEDKLDYARALDGLPARMPRLLLSHNPDVAEEPAFTGDGWRVDLMLSGHTHGGQIVLPFVGAPETSSRYGQKYAQGLVAGPTCPVYICRGIGVSGFPLRIGAAPEIAVLTLKCDRTT